MWSSKTDQWWFKLWKLIKDLKLEHLKSPCSVYLMWLFFHLKGKEKKIFRAQLPVSNIWNNRNLFVQKKKKSPPAIIWGNMYLNCRMRKWLKTRSSQLNTQLMRLHLFGIFFRVFSQLHKLHTVLNFDDLLYIYGQHYTVQTSWSHQDSPNLGLGWLLVVKNKSISLLWELNSIFL